MLTGLIVLEDTTIRFDIDDGVEKCKLTISDGLTGMNKTMFVTNEQLGAIVGTSICGTNEKVMTACEELVKSAFPADWPKELRPSPIC